MIWTKQYDEKFRVQTCLYFSDVTLNGKPIDWRWFKAQAIAESDLNPDAISEKGAVGLMQLMPKTSAEIAKILHLPDTPLSPNINIVFGIFHMRRMWNIWKEEVGLERLRFSFASYNAGQRNIIKAQRKVDIKNTWDSVHGGLISVTGLKNASETASYVARIERVYADFK